MEKEQITVAYKDLLLRMQEYFEAGERLIATRSLVESERMNALRDGRISGKNEEERKACARSVLNDLYQEAERAEETERLARHRLEIVRVIVEETRALLRLEELNVQVRENK